MSLELDEARRAREAQEALAREGARPRPAPPPQVRDPLPFCVWTTVALLAWVFTPAATVAAFGAVGLHAYARAWRAGLRRSHCVLGDPRIVMVYLGLLTAGGAAWTVWRLAALAGLADVP